MAERILTGRDGQSIVISLGGSLIVPNEIDVPFLRDFAAFVRERVKAGERLILITGGGKVCRRYQGAAAELGVSAPEQNDWLGIHVTRLNGQFLRIILGDLAEPEIVTDPSRPPAFVRPVAVAAGGVPGHSTDFDAVELAAAVGAKRVVNLSNIDYAYDKDPKRYPDARRIEDVSWPEFIKLLPERWDPGLNAPFDPVASRRASAEGISVALMNGRNLSNLRAYLDGGPFIGTLIHP